MKVIAVNLTLYKLCWLACVVGAASGMPSIGVLAVVVACVVNVATATSKSKALLLLGIAALIGLVWESAMVVSGWLDYSASGHQGNLAPYWIVALWVLFATTLNLGFRWLKGRLLIAALLGGVGGPLAFAAGVRAGAVEFAHPVYSLIIVGAGWAFLMPLMVMVAGHLNGHAFDKASTDRTTAAA